MNKKCSTCQLELPLSSFSDNSKKKDGKHNMCKTCHCEYRKQHYAKNKQRYIDKASKLKKDFQAWWRDYKSKFVCQNCGESHIACIDFHHTSDNKEAGVSYLVNNGCKDKVIAEIAKCIPLCRNCHAKVHWQERNMRH
jgi:hypothetical protein